MSPPGPWSRWQGELELTPRKAGDGVAADRERRTRSPEARGDSPMWQAGPRGGQTREEPGAAPETGGGRDREIACSILECRILELESPLFQNLSLKEGPCAAARPGSIFLGPLHVDGPSSPTCLAALGSALWSPCPRSPGWHVGLAGGHSLLVQWGGWDARSPELLGAPAIFPEQLSWAPPSWRPL